MTNKVSSALTSPSARADMEINITLKTASALPAAAKCRHSFDT